MSDSRYSYDDNGEVWPYFAVTLLGVVLVPLTGISLYNLKDNSIEGERKSTSTSTSTDSNDEFKPPNHDVLIKFRNSKKRDLFTAYNFFLLIGWGVMAGLIYIIILQRAAAAADPSKPAVFDPYEILGVSFSATEKQIKTTYRKLSLQLHPDKVRDLGNQTREAIESRYVDITKAYKALTDDVVRENFLKYGHPDGPQQTSHGIALPKFLVEGKGSPVVIAIYASVVGVLLPWFVGSWWAGTAIYTKNGIHQTTAAKFFEVCAKDQPHFINYDRILQILADTEELALVTNNKLNSKQIKQLLEDYLNRNVSSSSSSSSIDLQLALVSKSILLLDGLLDISSAFKSATLCQRVIEVKRCFIQAIPFKDQSIGEYVQIPGSDLVSKKSSLSNLNENQLESAREIPKLHFLNAYFKVPGESVIPPESQAHLIVKFAVTPLGSSAKLPKPAEFDPILLRDPPEEDETAKVLRDPLSTNELPPLIPYANAPYFPGLYRPVWYAFIVSEKDNKIIDGPVEMTRLSYDNLSLSDKEISQKGKDSTVEISTFKIQLTSATPPFPGMFSFKLLLLSSGYFGCDIIESVKMKVENPPVITEVSSEGGDEEDEYDISDPEEDTVAGALSQIRGGPVKKKRVESNNDEGDDDGSSDEEEDLTDIDTDTEVEDDDEDDEDEDESIKKNK